MAWKKLSGDVFRKPAHPLLLSVLFGTGMQLLTLTVSLLGATFAGSVSPFNLQIVTGLTVLLLPMCSAINGYSAGRLYAFLNGSDWKLLFGLASVGFPAILGTCLVGVDICEYLETGRSQSVMLSEGLSLTLLFFGVHVPLTFFGTFLGYKWSRIQTPTKTSRVPRDLPESLPWFMQLKVMAVVGGVIPVLVIGFELYQIL